MTTQPRRFHLLRHTDVTGVSGTGVVADGILWPDGTASVRWRGDRPSIVHWDRVEDAEAVHGHGGATEIVWTDEETPAEGVDLRVENAKLLRWHAEDGAALDEMRATITRLWVDRAAVLREAASRFAAFSLHDEADALRRMAAEGSAS